MLSFLRATVLVARGPALSQRFEMAGIVHTPVSVFGYLALRYSFGISGVLSISRGVCGLSLSSLFAGLVTSTSVAIYASASKNVNHGKNHNPYRIDEMPTSSGRTGTTSSCSRGKTSQRRRGESWIGYLFGAWGGAAAKCRVSLRSRGLPGVFFFFPLLWPICSRRPAMRRCVDVDLRDCRLFNRRGSLHRAFTLAPSVRRTLHSAIRVAQNCGIAGRLKQGRGGLKCHSGPHLPRFLPLRCKSAI
jgi:hypothetical protein